MSLEILAALTVVGLAILLGVAIIIAARRRKERRTRDKDQIPHGISDGPVSEAAVSPADPAESRPACKSVRLALSLL